MEIIILAAGRSLRYSEERPKYTLYDYKGHMMLETIIKKYIKNYVVNIVLSAENEKKFSIKNILKKNYPNKKLKIIILKKSTNGPAASAFQALKKINFKSDKEILIRDCDSFFDHKNLPGNYVCCFNVIDYMKTQNGNIKNKSYLKLNKFNNISQIVEKKIISNIFSIGGYKFRSHKIYMKFFKNLKNIVNREIYISDVIQAAIIDGEIFNSNFASNFLDLGTIQEWNEYNNKPVIFCDIDGTIIKSQKKNEYTVKSSPLNDNVIAINRMINKGSQIIFVTSRAKKNKNITTKMLRKIGFKKFELICGLNNSSRILINDFNKLNPYPRAIAINIERNSPQLNNYLNTYEN
jgi:hypothetical protein